MTIWYKSDGMNSKRIAGVDERLCSFAGIGLRESDVRDHRTCSILQNMAKEDPWGRLQEVMLKVPRSVSDFGPRWNAASENLWTFVPAL